MASDRSKWRKLIHESIESFENSRMQYSAYKRLIHKGEQGLAPGPTKRETLREKLNLFLLQCKTMW